MFLGIFHTWSSLSKFKKSANSIGSCQCLSLALVVKYFCTYYHSDCYWWWFLWIHHLLTLYHFQVERFLGAISIFDEAVLEENLRQIAWENVVSECNDNMPHTMRLLSATRPKPTHPRQRPTTTTTPSDKEDKETQDKGTKWTKEAWFV